MNVNIDLKVNKSLEIWLQNIAHLEINENLLRNQTFIKDLRNISVLLNDQNKERTPVNVNVFIKHNAFNFLTKLFAFLLDDLKQTHMHDDSTSQYELLRDFLEIAKQIVYRAGAYHNIEYFLRENILQITLDLLKDEAAVRFLFQSSLNSLSKIICLFYRACRKLYFNKQFGLFYEYVHAQKIEYILVNARDLLYNLH